MAISASQIVSITPRLLSAGGTDLELLGLILTKNASAPTDSLLSFASKKSVGKYFGTNSDEYAMAENYFLGYDNSYKKPSTLLFARRTDVAVAAFVSGSSITTTLADLKKITSGTLSGTIDGTAGNVTAINLQDATSFSTVATLITTAITSTWSGAKVSYDATRGNFTITSGTTGAESTITAFTGTVADALLLTADNVLISAGSAIKTPEEQMDGVINNSQNWVSFTTAYEADADEAVALAKWVNAQDIEYFYACYNSVVATVKAIQAEIAAQGYEGTAVLTGDKSYGAFLLSIPACIDWTRRQGCINFAFKSQTGLASLVNDDTTAQTLLDLNINFYGKYATRNDQFSFLYDGKLAAGNYGYIDNYINTVWFRNVIQVALMNGLTASPRTPYTEKGYTMIKAWLTDPINRALNNGVIEAGVNLSASQKAEVANEAGEDISNPLFANGFYVQVLDPGASARVNRESPLINVWYCYGGGVNKLQVPITALV